MPKSGIAPLLAAALVAVGSCAAPSEPPPSYAQSFFSAEDLKEASTAVVLGSAGPARAEEVGPAGFTVTRFAVSDSSDPNLVGTAITIRQNGSADAPPQGTTDILREGEEYFLFIAPFQFDDNQVMPGQYVITGEENGWRVADGPTFEPIFHFGPDIGLDRAMATELLSGALR